MSRTRTSQSSTTIVYNADDGFSRTSAAYNRNQKFLRVNVSDLKLRLKDFKQASQQSSPLTSLSAVIALWLPVFTSDFKGIAGLKPDSVQAGYVVLAILLSIVALRNLFQRVIFQLVRLEIIDPNDWQPLIDQEYLIRHESDPERLAEMMCAEGEDAGGV